MEIKNKVVVVTGGGNGMGRELVLNLLSRGAIVAAVDIKELALAETRQLAGDLQGSLSTYILDITDKEAVKNFPWQIISKQGRVDMLINNAGIIQPFQRVADLDDSTIEHVMDVNFYGALYMTRAFLPLLLMRSEASIVNVSSMGGFLPVPGQSIYGAAKAAVKIMTEGLRSELKHTNVKVSVVFPGAINTNIKAHSGAVEGGEDGREDGSPRDDRSNRANKTLSPVQAVQIIIKGIKKNSPRIFVGRDSRFLDLIYRLNPGFASNLIAGFMKSHIPE